VRVRLRSAQSPKTLIRRVAYESFQPQSDGFGICRGGTRGLRLFEEGFVDVEGLLYTYTMPYEYGYCILVAGKNCVSSYAIPGVRLDTFRMLPTRRLLSVR
jgi:hypothetical protein